MRMAYRTMAALASLARACSTALEIMQPCSLADLPSIVDLTSLDLADLPSPVDLPSSCSLADLRPCCLADLPIPPALP